MATDNAPTTITVSVTSNQSQLPATAMSSRGTTEFLVRFPPFPPVPEGVQIIPFKEFKEGGIRVQPGEDRETEVDACGVPTVALSSIHSTDWCKTETKRAKFNDNKGRKKKKRRTGGGGNVGPTWMDWEDYWEEREASYRPRNGYDPHALAYDRFCQGAYDFKHLRPWPLAQKQAGPVYVWGEFLRFAGIPLASDAATTAKAEEPSSKPKSGDDSDSDIDVDDEDENEPLKGILNPQQLAAMDAATKAQARGDAFLADPALMLKVFFSSYARDRGIIWTDVNLTGAPILMRFFINFLIDNKVLPKREENAIKHDSTRRVIELALKELPLTSKLAKVWPDDFHKACKACWGSKAEVFVFSALEPIEDVVMEDNGGENVSGWANSTDAADTEGNEGWESGGWTGVSAWGASTDDWDNGVVTVDVDEEGEVTADVVDVDAGSAPEASNEKDNEKAESDNWDAFKPVSLISLLGPIALPITHTTGIVESSLRRIKAVLPPSADTSKFPIVKDVSPDAVEGILRRTFGVVVFEPWVNWNKGEEPHLSMPKILESSRGTVKGENAGGGGEQVANPGALPPFDMHKEDINVLIDPAYIDLFSVGMGCLGTWVQLVRVEDLEPQDPKKKKKKKANMERFWYVEESLRVVPSYYTYLG
ncbi:hypothetical protein AN958_00716 [Leucoagaricus sp. SymC.cos]|nr:hypothetical protein AN958_00716 [Leucoagaricus sp. SymC.cos]